MTCNLFPNLLLHRGGFPSQAWGRWSFARVGAAARIATDAVADLERSRRGGVWRREAEVAGRPAARLATSRAGCAKSAHEWRSCFAVGRGAWADCRSAWRQTSSARVGEFGVRHPAATAEAVPATTRFFFLAVFLLSLFLSVPPAIAGSC